MNIKRFKILIVFILLAFSDQALAIKIPSSTCNQIDVQIAIDLAVDGDIVIIPEGICEWKLPVKISKKSLFLLGSGIDRTIILDGTGSAWSQEPLWIESVEGKPFRISGITFKGMQKRSSTEPAISIQGNCKNWRIDNCKFVTDLKGRGIIAKGYGLIDHCIFENTTQGVSVIGDGDESWNSPLSLGTVNSVYVEDCQFIYGEILDGALDAYNGARYVFRYNFIKNTNVGHHGLDSGGYRSTHSYERYNNTFYAPDTRPWTVFGSRGGTGLDFNNSANGGYGKFSIVINYRSCNEYPMWGKCDGQNMIDGNQEQNGYPCSDQVGRTSFQEYSPVYEWNNYLNGQNADISIHDPWGCPALFDHIKENREFYNDTTRPDYIPFEYPHPLVNANLFIEDSLSPPTSPPEVPTNLKLIK